jgi:hypothetical protein
MVIHFLRQERHARHEAEGCVEVFEAERARDCLTPLHFMPLWKFP